jgi:ferredoxin--NADP+ reductase
MTDGGCRREDATSGSANVVLANTALSPLVHRIVIHADRIAQVRRPGQFVIVHLGPSAERVPLTIADADAEAGTITLVIQAVGKSTRDLVALSPGDVIDGVSGPLGRPTDLVGGARVACVGGGVGTAVLLPIARALHALGNEVTSVIGARSADAVLFAAELAEAGLVIVCTDDGSAGRQGLVTDALGALLAADAVDVVYAAGPVPMMAAVADLTRASGTRTVVSLNPIMVDGTGMCGGCRVTVDGEMRFACVDGPEFEAHGVDFGELADRLGTYRTYERRADEPGGTHER